MEQKENQMTAMHQQAVSDLNQKIILGTQQTAHIVNQASQLEQANTVLKSDKDEADRRIGSIVEESKMLLRQGNVDRERIEHEARQQQQQQDRKSVV